MLTFYYHPLSPVARRVWLALLEKELAFRPVQVDLTGGQHQPEFLALNPFHHVPVVTDGELRIVESLAILDYLEAKHPSPALLPAEPAAIAQMRMVQLVTANELMPKLPALAAEPDAALQAHLATVLDFLSAQLGDREFFGGDRLSLADLTAGAVLPLLVRFGFSLAAQPNLATWHDRLAARPAWQQTEPDDSAFATWQRWLVLQRKRYLRRLARA